MMTRSRKKELYRIIAAAVLLIAAALLPVEGLLRLAVFLVPYFIVGYKPVLKAAKNIAHGQIFDENFLMAIATIGAFIVSEYPEAVFVMLFYEVGELFEHIAVGKSRKAISGLMNIRPDYANIERDGELIEVNPDEVPEGSVIVVKPGERIPIDGVITEGKGEIDTRALTGESVPGYAEAGDRVISGCVNMSGLLRIRTTGTFENSTVSKILELVENSASNKAKSEAFITRFARWYTPAVVIGAVLLAVVPSLVTGEWSKWIYQALTFLVISCPCALVISVPLTFFGGIGGASRNGILVKGSNYLEMLSKADAVVFDKTGTLTEGSFSVTQVCPTDDVGEDELIEKAALCEIFSDHPIARSLRKRYEGKSDNSRVTEYQEIPGHGVKAIVDGKTVICGNFELIREQGLSINEAEEDGTVVYVLENGRYMGYIVISDRVKENAFAAIAELRKSGIKTVMLTGDRKKAANAVAEKLGIDEVYSELLPQDKVAMVEKLIEGGAKTLFVGDGINDAPVLARADIGAAMGALGADAAIEAADVVIMDDDPAKLTAAMDISRKVNRIARENITFALAVKAVILILGVFGTANMWFAVFADVGVMVIAVMNAMRAMALN